MKLLFCGFLAFLAFENVQNMLLHRPPPGPPSPFEIPDFDSEYMTSFRERMELRKLENQVDEICPGYGNRVENVTDSMKDCFNVIDTDNDTLCASVKKYTVQCTQPAVDLFEECLPTDAKEIPSFLIRLLKKMSEYFCKSDGEHLLELHNKCVLTPTYKFKRCLRKVATFRQQISQQRRHLTVDNVCQLMTSLKSCMTSHLNLQCGSPITRAAVTDLMDEALSACPNVNVDSNEVELVNPNEE